MANDIILNCNAAVATDGNLLFANTKCNINRIAPMVYNVTANLVWSL